MFTYMISKQGVKPNIGDFFINQNISLNIDSANKTSV